MSRGKRASKGTKRGRPKKEKEVDVVPKKRGRKPKILKTDNDAEEEKTSLMVSPVVDKVKGESKIRASTPKTPKSRRIGKTGNKDSISLTLDVEREEEENILRDVPILNESVCLDSSVMLDDNIIFSKNESNVSSRSEDKENLPSQSMDFDMNERNELICTICQQKMDNIKFYNNEPVDGQTEENSILDYRLVLFNGQEENNYSQEDIRAYNRITCFSVYCKHGHLCPFDSGLIEKDTNIYFSGYIKPIYSENSSVTDGISIPGKNFGPVVEWWITGFNIGEEPRVGLSTELGDYLLMDPSPEYASFIENARLKTLISKTIIEFILHEPNASYEDLMRKIQTTQMPDNRPEIFTEDNLISLAPFICRQIKSFDEFADPEEPLLIVAPCMRRLIDLAGIDFRSNYRGKPLTTKIREETKKSRKKKLLFDSDEENCTLTEFDQKSLIDMIFDYNEITNLTVANPEILRKCESCDKCLRPPCGDCPGCSKKKGCWRRRCFWREIQNANKQDEQSKAVISPKSVKYCNQAYQDSILPFKEYRKDVTLLGPPVAFDNGNAYYGSAKITDVPIFPGDFVFLRPDNSLIPSQVLKVVYIYEDNTGEPKFHGKYYWWGRDTVLGEFANPKELFCVGFCSDATLLSIQKKVTVIERQKPLFWNQIISSEKFDEDTFFCEKSFDILTGRFSDLPEKDEDAKKNSRAPHRYCEFQEDFDILEARKKPCVFNKLNTDGNRIIYEKVLYKDEEYFFGSTVYLKPRKLYFKYPMSNYDKMNSPVKEVIDETKYPEYYRKEPKPLKNPNETQPPLDIGFITQIFTIEEKIFIKIKRFFRPENTHEGRNLSKKSHLNVLFWSEEESIIEFSFVTGKCYVVHEKSLSVSVDKWTAAGPDRFYFSKEYKLDEKKFVDVDAYIGSIVARDVPKEYPYLKKLKSLNIFAGCGGLAMGLQRSGLASVRCAIESDAVQASVFQLNMTKATVLNADVKSVLYAMKKGQEELNGQKLPIEDEFELLCASIPGKNYKSLENFKNSHVATFIEYCEYYRPILFVMDADENLIKQNSFLKLTLSCLIAIGYQVSFNIMQVGNYGVPQNRKRSVLLGAAPGHKLPKYPKNLHVFPSALSQFFVIIDDKKYSPVEDWNNSAPFRAVTVYDAISDLPVISFGQYKNHLDYYGKLLTHYQKLMRLDLPESSLFDHECKKIGVLPQTRLFLLPQTPGTDWRNLPNTDLKLSDGTNTNKLVYTHEDVEAGRGNKGELRGVCSCANGGACDLGNRQENTVIPWHLVHTAKQHKQWAGLYSRLEWDGFFGNITNPEPLGTEGPVIHPQQPRIVSVRECARAQGFPDDFKLGDTTSIHDKYKIIGEATSPLLAVCLGNEIVKSLL